LAVGCAGHVQLWDPVAGKEAGQLKRAGDALSFQAMCVAFSPDGKTLAAVEQAQRDAATWETHLRLWDVDGQKVTASLRVPDGQGWSLCFAPDGKTLAGASGADNVIVLWDPATGKERGRFRGHKGQVRSVRFAPDGEAVASLSLNQALVWDPATQKVLRSFERTLIRDLDDLDEFAAFAPDGNSVASVHGQWPATEVRVWDVATGAEKVRLRNHAPDIRAVAFAPDGKTLAVASGDGSVKLWDLASGTAADLPAHGFGPLALTFAPGGRRLAVGVYDVTLWGTGK
jgi:WD40 repeat protein